MDSITASRTQSLTATLATVCATATVVGGITFSSAATLTSKLFPSLSSTVALGTKIIGSGFVMTGFAISSCPLSCLLIAQLDVKDRKTALTGAATLMCLGTAVLTPTACNLLGLYEISYITSTIGGVTLATNFLDRSANKPNLDQQQKSTSKQTPSLFSDGWSVNNFFKDTRNYGAELLRKTPFYLTMLAMTKLAEFPFTKGTIAAGCVVGLSTMAPYHLVHFVTRSMGRQEQESLTTRLIVLSVFLTTVAITPRVSASLSSHRVSYLQSAYYGLFGGLVAGTVFDNKFEFYARGKFVDAKTLAALKTNIASVSISLGIVTAVAGGVIHALGKVFAPIGKKFPLTQGIPTAIGISEISIAAATLSSEESSKGKLYTMREIGALALNIILTPIASRYFSSHPVSYLQAAIVNVPFLAYALIDRCKK